MKNVLFGLALTLSFSAFADSKIEDAAYLSNCSGKVELRSYTSPQGEEKFALQFEGVKTCSNVRTSAGKDYKLTDANGKFLNSKNITLSDVSVAAAKSNAGLGIIVESNNGHTADNVIVKLAAPAAPTPTNDNSGDSTPGGWN